MRCRRAYCPLKNVARLTAHHQRTPYRRANNARPDPKKDSEDLSRQELQAYCVRCHNSKTTEGELDLTRYNSVAALGEGFRQWEHIVTFLKKEEMAQFSAVPGSPIPWGT